LAGFSTALVAVLLYFWRAGLWRTLWESHFQLISRYVASELTPDYWILPFAGAIYGLGFWTVAATAVALSIAWKERELSAFGPIFLGTATGYASVLMQVRLSSYEFEACYPFFAMVWGYLAVKSFASCRALTSGLAGRGWRWGRVLLWILVATGAFWLMRSEALSWVQGYRELAQWLRNEELFYASYPAQFPLEHLGGQMQVIHYLREKSAPGDQVFVWGAHPLIYYLSGLHSPVRFVTNFPLIATWGPPAWREELMRELERSHPAFIVVARRDQIPSVTFTNLDSEEYLKVFPELNGFISRSYQPVVQSRDFVIYHLKIPPRKGE
jgi:hypothetical protein